MREYREIYNYKQYKRRSRVTKRKLEKRAGRPGRIGPRTGLPLINDAPLRNSDQQEVHQGPSSKIWTCKFRTVRNSPTSDKMSVKWHAGISIRVSINPNHKHTLKIVSWAQAYLSKNETSNDGIIRCDKTSCTGSVDRFMRLIPRGDNLNKETLIYISYTSCLHRLSTHNLSCPQ